MKRVLSPPEVDEWVQHQRASGLSIGFTCGAFDFLHAGHVHYLEQAAALCDRLLVAVNSDNSIRQYKNPLRPLNSQEHRMQVIAALRSVSAVTLMEDTRPVKLIQRWQPDFYIKGGDYAKTQLRSGGEVEAYGGKVVLIPVEEQISTTKLIERAAHTLLYAPVSKVAGETEVSRLVMLDRDGTVIKNVPHLNNAAQVELLPGVGDGLAKLQSQGFKLVLVTNQQGLGLGYFDYPSFIAVNQATFRLLVPYGVKISKIYYCPHSFAEDCRCRKPGSELLERALRDFRASAAESFFIGDSQTDMEAAEGAGCRGLLVDGSEGSLTAAIASIEAFV